MTARVRIESIQRNVCPDPDGCCDCIERKFLLKCIAIMREIAIGETDIVHYDETAAKYIDESFEERMK